MVGHIASPAGRAIPSIVKLRRSWHHPKKHKKGMMAANLKLMIVEAERRFPCRIKLGIAIGVLASA
jgi:hypothetical protein